MYKCHGTHSVKDQKPIGKLASLHKIGMGIIDDNSGGGTWQKQEIPSITAYCVCFVMATYNIVTVVACCTVHSH